MNHLTELHGLLSKLRFRQRIVRKELSRCPSGRLAVTHDHGYTSFIEVVYESGVRKRFGINKKPERVVKLARKAYLEEETKRLKKNIERIERMIDGTDSLEPADILRTLPANYEVLDREILFTGRKSGLTWPNPSRDPSVRPKRPALDTGALTPGEWGALPYCENTSFAEYKKHFTSRGVACRSKSEIAILEKYDSLGIPYHCDETIVIGNTTLAPDVVGARADGKLIYHEHFGLRDESYKRRNTWKLELYESAGIRLGDNLICTFDREDESLNMELVEAQIRDRYFTGL